MPRTTLRILTTDAGILPSLAESSGHGARDADPAADPARGRRGVAAVVRQQVDHGLT
jgi:hypothetical protein